MLTGFLSTRMGLGRTGQSQGEHTFVFMVVVFMTSTAQRIRASLTVLRNRKGTESGLAQS